MRHAGMNAKALLHPESINDLSRVAGWFGNGAGKNALIKRPRG
jgi:hypothetical protein